MSKTGDYRGVNKIRAEAEERSDEKVISINNMLCICGGSKW